MLAGRLQLLSRWFCTAPSEPLTSLLQIVEKRPINHDCYVYKLKFVENPFKLAIGQHFRIVETVRHSDKAEAEEVIRKYTPISPCDQEDIDLMIKIYRPNQDITHPLGGKLTPHLEKLEVGDNIHVEGPLGKFQYQPGGKVKIGDDFKQFKHLFFMAGGSGITPCYQVIRQIASMPQEDIKLTLLFGNKTAKDIIMTEELSALRKRADLHYILDQPPKGWKGLKGLITEQVIKSICPLDDPDTLFLHCGPFGMNAQIKHIFKKKYPPSDTFKF